MPHLPFEKQNMEVLVKKQSSTSDKFGQDPYKRSTEELLDYGIVNIDKPSGPTSHQVSAYVQQILGIKKSGHSGTLDPRVTGVLPVAFGRATRIVQVLLTAGKEYVALMHLHQAVDEQKLRQAFKEFTGRIRQLPPIKSSVKRQWRYRNVYYMEILEIDGQEVLFRIGCEAGTYIRKICHDLGQKLEVGAHMSELRRSKAGCFDESTLCTLQDLADAIWYYRNEGNDRYLRTIVRPVEFAVRHVPKVWILDSTVEPLCHGTNLAIPGISKLNDGIEPEQRVAVMTLKDELVATGTAKLSSGHIMKLEKGIAVEIDKVFLKPGTYPRAMKANPQ